MNAPAPHADFAASALLPLVTFAPSSTRTQARRRARFTKEEIAELAANIKAVGIVQPIVARPHPKIGAAIGPVQLPVKYEIVAGERRWLAADLAGLLEIPAIIRDVPDADIITLQLTENLQRKDPDQLEEAEAYDELRKAKKITADQVADLVGMSRTTVFNRLKLLDLCPEGSDAVVTGKLTPSVALLIARLPDPKMQAKAVKGCLGDYKALQGFEGENSAWNKPLSHEDAELYIKEQFTTRIEGAAAINKAKSEGKAVIAGKEAEKIWKRAFAGPAGYIQLSEHYWSGNQRKTYASAIGDNPPGTVLIQSPHTGAAEKCLPRDKAIAIFKEKKLTLPNDLQPREVSHARRSTTAAKPLTPEATAKQQIAQAGDLIQGDLERDITIAIFKAMRPKYPSKLGKPELLEALELMNDGGYYRIRGIQPTPKSLAKCSERELVCEILDELYCPADNGECSGSKKEFLAAAKRHGVNVEKIKKDLTQAAEEKLEEISAQINKKLIDTEAAKPAAAAKKAAKAKGKKK